MPRWLVNSTGLLIGRCADWSRQFISNPDWQLCYLKQTFTGLLLKLGSAFEVRFVSAWGLLWFALCPIGVRSSGPRPDPKSQPEVWFGSAFCYVGSGRYCINFLPSRTYKKNWKNAYEFLKKFPNIFWVSHQIEKKCFIKRMIIS